MPDSKLFFIYLSNARTWLLDHLTPSLPVPTDYVISRVFVESSALEQVVAIHSGMATKWTGLVSSHAKPVEVYSQVYSEVMYGAKAGNNFGSLQMPWRKWSTRVSHGLPKLFIVWDYGNIFVNVCRDDALYSSEGQGNFRLSRLGSLLGFWVSSFIAGDPNMTWDPL
ncbi:uncharacterized protein TNCV_3479871 [Trichonephila clavipes]|nr:uncharacterized protein TNCV_3479871 [Trichonephila clavipes]